MVTRALALLLLISLPLPATGGAWLREEGTTFLSLGFEARRFEATGHSLSRQELYIEHGLRPKLTIGAKGNLDSDSTATGEIFARFPLRADDCPGRIAAEIGIGGEHDGFVIAPYLRTGVSWGRGIKIARKSGWVNVDGAVEWPIKNATEDPLWKLDATVGLSLSERSQIMFQAFFESSSGRNRVTLNPSYIFRTKNGTRYVGGIAHRTGTDGYTSLRFGIWREF
ncbi:hypothetical protein E4Z66_06850 [Aliishimia ponticola]|uniref:Cellulose biosynthesis protein BcsS n=1 Tax=Aliishimia ponticola TaxID=2499833 RepID=A0A4V3XKE2_9RHOB|nr:hypothetical protein [Aliishimia ponticola]THH36663.1 hypothetical protein E4Z66_06850 [Aliishimia ponticola]